MFESIENAYRTASSWSKTVNWLSDWITRTTNEVIRIHISHNDLDGLGCFVVEDMYRTFCIGVGDQGTIWDDVVDKPDDVAQALSDKIKFLEAVGHIVQDKSQIMVLVTDLCPDPVIFTKLIDEGYDLTFCIVDHHEHLQRHCERIKADKVLRSRGTIMVDTRICATKSLMDLMESVPTSWRYVTNRKAFLLRSFVLAVDNFDTGHWGKWADLSFDEVDQSVLEQLVFAAYRKEEKVFEWVKERTEQIDNGLDFNENRKWRNIATSELNKLMTELSAFKSRMVDMTQTNLLSFSASIDGKTRFFPMLAPNVCGVVAEHEPAPKNFSLISRKILEDDPNIDILVLVDCERKAVHLRSGQDGPNVAEIAILNGGGGHPRAAGFPLKLDTKE